jgi:hypothetical protein
MAMLRTRPARSALPAALALCCAGLPVADLCADTGLAAAATHARAYRAGAVAPWRAHRLAPLLAAAKRDLVPFGTVLTVTAVVEVPLD